jgi:hypothetical protein
VTNSKLYLAPRKCPDARILHHFVVSFRGPRQPPDPSPEASLASLTPFSIYSKKKILLFNILMKPLNILSLQNMVVMAFLQYKTEAIPGKPLKRKVIIFIKVYFHSKITKLFVTLKITK